jgi:hypothetical protein
MKRGHPKGKFFKIFIGAWPASAWKILSVNSSCIGSYAFLRRFHNFIGGNSASPPSSSKMADNQPFAAENRLECLYRC